MKVEELSNLIGKLAEGLRPVVAAGVVNDLLALGAAMGPFEGRTVAEFTKFLGQCEEFQRTGAVAGGGKKGGKSAAAAAAAADPARVSSAVDAVRALLREIDGGGVDGRRIDEALRPLDALGKPDVEKVLAGLEIVGGVRSKKQGLDKIRAMVVNQAEAGSRVRAMGEYR